MGSSTEEAKNTLQCSQIPLSPNMQPRVRRRLNVEVVSPAQPLMSSPLVPIVVNTVPRGMPAPSPSLSPVEFLVGENLVPILGGEPPILSQEGESCQRGCVVPSDHRRGEGQHSPPRRMWSQENDMDGARLVGVGETSHAQVFPAVVHTQGVGRRGRGRARGGGRSVRAGRRRQRVVVGEALNLLPTPAPEGWRAPPILSDRSSPVLLRPRPMFRAMDTIPSLEELDFPSSEGDSDFTTPPPRSRPPSTVDSQSGICRFTLADFQPGAPVPDTLSRQSIGGYVPWQHDCGEENCPFLDGSSTARRRAMELGFAFETVESPDEHARVDHRAFRHPEHVLVKLSVLGLDCSLWGDIEHFRGLVRHRYYHEVTGAPMYTVDFDGGVGLRELRVCDTELDHSQDSPASARRVLDFFVLGNSTRGDIDHSTANTSHVHVQASYDSDRDDFDWKAAYEDFEGAETSSTSSLSPHAYLEVPLLELGFYDPCEDTSSWDFATTWDDDQWQEPNMSLLGNRENFTGPTPGPTGELAGIPGGPQQYFLHFWPPEVLAKIVEETNRYAAQDSHGEPHLTNGRHDWVDLTPDELLCWFGVLILMGLKHLPHRRLYWDRRHFYYCPIIAMVMTRQRFEAIVRCVHLVNNETLVHDTRARGYDKIGKVRWLLESFTRISQSLYNAERVCTVDEIMVPYKGRYCNIRQYMKSKPCKFGIKLWALASSQLRYIHNVIVYLGASDAAREPGELISEQAVLQSIQGLEHRGHVIVCDNFFTSVQLCMSLMERGFWMTGTVKKGSRGFPTSLAGLSKKSELPPRGTLMVKMHRSRQDAAVCWIDNKPVWLLSSATDPVDPSARAQRWLRSNYEERFEFPTSPILLEYQRNMRGVDVVDQLRGEYTVQLQSQKWWHRLLLFVLDSSCMNGYILYQEDAQRVGLPVHSRLLWHYDLGMALVGAFLTPGAVRGPHRNLTPAGFHRLEGSRRSRRMCIVYSNRTRRFCAGCAGAFMCEGACFIRVHTQPGHAARFRR